MQHCHQDKFAIDEVWEWWAFPDAVLATKLYLRAFPVAELEAAAVHGH